MSRDCIFFRREPKKFMHVSIESVVEFVVTLTDDIDDGVFKDCAIVSIAST